MEMNLERFVEDGIASRHEYDDRTVFVVDFGVGADPDVDVVDGTVIVVTADGRQREFQLPAGDVRAFNRNGVVSIEVRP